MNWRSGGACHHSRAIWDSSGGLHARRRSLPQVNCDLTLRPGILLLLMRQLMTAAMTGSTYSATNSARPLLRKSGPGKPPPPPPPAPPVPRQKAVSPAFFYRNGAPATIPSMEVGRCYPADSRRHIEAAAAPRSAGSRSCFPHLVRASNQEDAYRV
jgi:hypothetical protein